MQTSVIKELQNPNLAVPGSRAQRAPSDHDAAEGKKAHLKIVRSVTLPEDVVTLTDSDRPGTKTPPASNTPSLPVTTAEKQALLGPHPSGYNFSVYG